MGEGRERGASLLWLRIPEGWGGAVRTPDQQIPLNPSRPRWTRAIDEHARVEGGPEKGPVGHLWLMVTEGKFSECNSAVCEGGSMGHPPESQKSEAALSHQIGNGAPGRDIGVS